MSELVTRIQGGRGAGHACGEKVPCLKKCRYDRTCRLQLRCTTGAVANRRPDRQARRRLTFRWHRARSMYGVPIRASRCLCGQAAMCGGGRMRRCTGKSLTAGARASPGEGIPRIDRSSRHLPETQRLGYSKRVSPSIRPHYITDQLRQSAAGRKSWAENPSPLCLADGHRLAGLHTDATQLGLGTVTIGRLLETTQSMLAPCWLCMYSVHRAIISSSPQRGRLRDRRRLKPQRAPVYQEAYALPQASLGRRPACTVSALP